MCSGPDPVVADGVKNWSSDGRFWPGLGFNTQRGYSTQMVEQRHARGDLAVLAEITTQYEGIEPGDPRLAPYWALAE